MGTFMKITLFKGTSAYDSLAGVLKVWANNHKRYETLIVDIKTSILGEDRIVATTNSYGDFDFLDDWYEGGDLELLGITPIGEVGEPKYKL